MSIRLPKTNKKSGKRVGRGYGSGKGGHTAGRGMKGQKSRNKRHILFEGLKMKKSFVKRLPLRRGKGKFKSRPKPIVVKLQYLDLFRAGSTVDIESLIKEGIVNEKDARTYGVKILGGGEFKKKLTINLPMSHSASEVVKKAGGKVIADKDQEKSNSSEPKVKPKKKKGTDSSK